MTAPAEVPQSALEGLHEILLPDSVSWMPQTAGWYAVFGLALLVSGWWVYRRLRRFRQNRYRRLALEELSFIERDLQQPEKCAKALAGIPVLLKAAALSAFPRNEVAGLSGEAWLSFLDKTLGGNEFTEGEGRLLPELAYAPAPGIAGLSDERISSLLQLTRRWIKGHRFERLTPAAVILTLMISLTTPGFTQEKEAQAQAELSADEAARQLANPNTPLASLTLKTQVRWYEGDLPGSDRQDNLSFLFQPSLPFPISKRKTDEGEIMDQIFFRPAVPYQVDQPLFDLESRRFRGKTGFGDIGFDLAWGRNHPSGLLVAAGVVGSVPTGKNEISTRTWTLGPEALVASFQKWGIVGVFPSHQWNVGGHDDRPTSLTSIQPIALFLPGGGWSVGTAGTLTYDWEQSQWTIPLQLQVSKTIKMGRVPVKLAWEANYYVEHADAFGPEWMIGFNITPVLPNFLAKWLGLAN